MKDDILVTVIMSVYNTKPSYLKTAVQSILEQTYQNIEFIIVNDGSNENRLESLMQKYAWMDSRIILLSSATNQGKAFQLNRAISISHGQYIALMDADDISERSRIEKQLQYMLSHNLDISSCFMSIIDIYGDTIKKVFSPVSEEKIRKVIMRYSPLFHGCSMYKKEVFDDFLFNEQYRGAEDYEFFMRVIASGKYKISNLAEYLYRYRYHKDAYTWQSKETEWAAIKVRLLGLFKYKLPLWQIIFVIKPFISFFIPLWIKRKVFQVR